MADSLPDKSFATIKVAVDDGILRLTLYRPDQMNAFTVEMMREMREVFDWADENDDIGAIIITGDGERAFCAGADLSMGAATFDGDKNPNRNAGLQRDGGGILTLRIFDSKKPVIGAINGAAVGIGVTMILPMDIRIASTTARFGFVFARRGIVMEAASSWFLPRIVGISKALEWVYSGRVFDAEEALAGGLVRSLHPPAELMPAATSIAREIIDNNAPVSIALSRHMMWRMLGAKHPMEAHRIDSRGIYYRGKSKDAHEGVTAFLEKRPPKFPNKVSSDMPEYFPWWDEQKFS